jgi:hypothetical protein
MDILWAASLAARLVSPRVALMADMMDKQKAVSWVA